MPHAHPNLVHQDDVDPTSLDAADMRHRRRRLGAAGGARMIGASHYLVPAGARMMPVHAHSDEEEIFHVLAGSGLLWEGGRTYPIAAGDTIVHRIQSAPHTLLAGEEDLEVLAFGEGSLTNITYLPRPQAWWIGTRWMPADGPNPFKREAALGPLELPADGPTSRRPDTVVAFADVEEAHEVRPGFAITERNLAKAAGSVRSGLRHDVLAPGTLSCPPHWHTGEEELFVVLAGDGFAVLGEERLPIRPGSVLVRPPNSGVAHTLQAGEDGLTYLAYGTRDPNDICFYPRSNKANFGGITFRLDVVDYWHGEERPL
ncbi:MAG: hypothetical protein JWM31_3729 [Solirubrobacterales bacterium]|nr:hypothetical protein [Solirubrobacterales bacterium]